MNNQAPGLQKELFSPHGSLICVLLEALSCALSPQGLPRFLRETPMAQLTGCDGHHKIPFPQHGGTPPHGRGGHLEEGREGGRNLDVPH